MAAYLSVLQGWIDKGILDRTTALLARAKLPTAPPKGMTSADFMRLMAVDKKVEDGGLKLILLKGPLGGCVISKDFSQQALLETLTQFCH